MQTGVIAENGQNYVIIIIIKEYECKTNKCSLSFVVQTSFIPLTTELHFIEWKIGG